MCVYNMLTFGSCIYKKAGMCLCVYVCVRLRVNETCHLQSSSCCVHSAREHKARVQPA